MAVEFTVAAHPSEFPCCGHTARFAATVAEMDEVRRRCRQCGILWRIERTKGLAVNGVRFDDLTWHVLSTEASEPEVAA